MNDIMETDAFDFDTFMIDTFATSDFQLEGSDVHQVFEPDIFDLNQDDPFADWIIDPQASGETTYPASLIPMSLRKQAGSSELAIPLALGSPDATSPPAIMRKKKAQTLRESDWEPYKSRIVELHIEEKRPIPDVKRIIEREFAFKAEIRQYRLRLSQWKLDKNVKPREMKWIVKKRQQRNLVEVEKKDLTFNVRGQEVDPQKIERWMKRHDVHGSMLYSPTTAASTPSAVGCRTISELGSPAPSQTLTSFTSQPNIIRTNGPLGGPSERENSTHAMYRKRLLGALNRAFHYHSSGSLELGESYDYTLGIHHYDKDLTSAKLEDMAASIATTIWNDIKNAARSHHESLVHALYKSPSPDMNLGPEILPSESLSLPDTWVNMRIDEDDLVPFAQRLIVGINTARPHDSTSPTYKQDISLVLSVALHITSSSPEHIAFAQHPDARYIDSIDKHSNGPSKTVFRIKGRIYSGVSHDASPKYYKFVMPESIAEANWGSPPRLPFSHHVTDSD